MANKIIIEPVDTSALTFQDPEIRRIVEEAAVSFTGGELTVDVLEPELEYEVFVDYQLLSSDDYVLYSSDGYELRPYSNYDIRTLPRATKLKYYINNTLHGVFYSKNVERVGKSQYKINCVSAVGLMDKQPDKGGIFTGQTFKTVLAAMLGTDYDYQLTDAVAALQIYGWLPSSTRRNNLHQLLVATGATIVRADSGGMLFTLLGDTTPEEIPSGRIYINGNVDYGNIASRVEVTEHAFFYLDSVAAETVFDNTRSDAVVKATVTFDKPFYPSSLYCSEGSLQIVEAGVNYAIVSGTGVLMGKPYTHTTRIVAADNPDAPEENVLQLKDATLVTVANADNVLLRLSQYAFNATTLQNSIVLENELPGRRYTMLNAFYEQSTGFLSKLSASASGITKADCEFIENYVPVAQGNAYTSLAILPAASGTWTIPQKVKDKEQQLIRIVLIGGGESGTSGTKGSDGTEATLNQGSETVTASGTPGKGGAPGVGGLGGNGGKIYSITLDCAGLTSITYGRSGLNTFVNVGGDTFNSNDGASSSTGWLEIFNGVVYALPGHAGQPGAKGGDGGLYKPPKYSGSKDATAGSDVTYNGKTYKGGAPGPKKVLQYNASIDTYYGGPAGGGAAVGANGNAGLPPSKTDSDHLGLASVSGNGANGAKGDAPIARYGCGGNGGNGGGGGGGADVAAFYNVPYAHWFYVESGIPGKGGSPGAGSNGYQGAVLIYY